MSVKEKATAPVSSVGADGKQPLCKLSYPSYLFGAKAA